MSALILHVKATDCGCINVRGRLIETVNKVQEVEDTITKLGGALYVDEGRMANGRMDQECRH